MLLYIELWISLVPRSKSSLVLVSTEEHSYANSPQNWLNELSELGTVLKEFKKCWFTDFEDHGKEEDCEIGDSLGVYYFLTC